MVAGNLAGELRRLVAEVKCRFRRVAGLLNPLQAASAGSCFWSWRVVGRMSVEEGRAGGDGSHVVGQAGLVVAGDDLRQTLHRVRALVLVELFDEGLQEAGGLDPCAVGRVVGDLLCSWLTASMVSLPAASGWCVSQ